LGPFKKPELKDEIAAEIASIGPLDAREHEDMRATLDWIRSGAGIFRIAKPDKPPKHLIAYFVVVDSDHVLLVDHKNSGLWLPPGGHVDPGEHPRDTVIREAVEELGMKAQFERPEPVMLTVVETVGRTAGHTDVCLWYVLAGDRQVSLDYCREEFNSIRWFHRDEVPATRVEPNLARFFRKFYGPESVVLR